MPTPLLVPALSWRDGSAARRIPGAVGSGFTFGLISSCYTGQLSNKGLLRQTVRKLWLTSYASGFTDDPDLSVSLIHVTVLQVLRQLFYLQVTDTEAGAQRVDQLAQHPSH